MSRTRTLLEEAIRHISGIDNAVFNRSLKAVCVTAVGEY